MRSEVFRAQIRETICEHLEKQERLAPLGIKVLSLFFIDRVENYTAEKGIIRRLFDEIFDELKRNYAYFKDLPAEQVRGSYFAKKKVREAGVETEIALNTESRNKDEKEAEKAAFSLIMRDKEKILSFDEPTSFIFAHSALREGWDNPNVFQICTLNQSHSDIKKRQEIGRGLRLSVNQNGERIFDDDINILRVVANESYQSFVEKLQEEYREAGEEAPPTPTKPRPSTVIRNDELFNGTDFREFWAKLSRRTSYKIKIDTEQLILECVQKLQVIKFPEPKIIITKGRFVLTNYKLKLEKIENGAAHIKIEKKTSDGAIRIDTLPVVAGTKLDRALNDAALRDFKVLEIIDEEDAEKVIFANEQILTRYQEAHLDVAALQKPSVPQIKAVESEKFPVFDFIGRAVKETSLTRKTLNRIFFGLSEPIQKNLFRNPEGFADKFIEGIRDALAVHVAKNVEFTVSSERAFDLNDLFPPEKKIPQRELVDACESGLYNKVQVDSEVEMRFVERHLRRYPNVVLYFKFPPKFKLDFPSLIHDYNPDWGIIRKAENGNYRLEIVIETKGTTNIDKLRFSSEGWKIRCAERYFEALGIAYKVSDDQSFDWDAFTPHKELSI
jgi:type III restriction enzyme